MQDAELFFQAADHRHLFLYIDGLAETEARRQADVCNYVKKHLDDYEALQKKVERLEQELQQKKDACALLQKQLAQQNSEAAAHSSQKTTTADKQAGTAPAQDNAEDWYRLGEQYACGEGVPRDYDRARQWYAKAARQGHAHALLRLGDIHKEGKGVPRNGAKAQQWYAKAAATLQKAAEQGDADAQFSLGDMYKKGEGVPQDDDMACQWYAKAAAQGHEAGLNALKQLAEQKNATAQFCLGEMYDYGKGVPQDDDRARQRYTKAAATFKKAAEQGDADAQFRLGDMYKEGKGLPRDGDMACRCYAKAAAQGHEAGLKTLKQLAEQGNATAQFCLGEMYNYGKGVPQDDDRARQWYAEAAEQGDADAQFRLGETYDYGEGVLQDDGRACQWYAKAAVRGHEAGLSALIQLAEQGNADAQYRLGCMYRKGEGVPQDYDLARRWFEKAIAQGHADALNDFGEMYYYG